MHMPSLNTVAPTDQPKGLYQPHEFKDNCGFGLIAHMQGKQSHHLVETAIHSLSCMTHRGGIAADGKTGDGCGLLLAMPKSAKAGSCVWCSVVTRFMPVTSCRQAAMAMRMSGVPS